MTKVKINVTCSRCGTLYERLVHNVTVDQKLGKKTHYCAPCRVALQRIRWGGFTK